MPDYVIHNFCFAPLHLLPSRICFYLPQIIEDNYWRHLPSCTQDHWQRAWWQNTAQSLHLELTLHVPQCSHLWRLFLPATVFPLPRWGGTALCVLWSCGSSLLSRRTFSYLACSGVSLLLGSGRQGERNCGISDCLTWKPPLSAQNPGFYGVSHCALLTSHCLWALEDFTV